MNGCCWGGVCDLPWGVTFPLGSEPFKQQLADQIIPITSTRALPVHPTQLYEAVGLLLLFALMWWWFHQKTFEHRLMWLYLVLYGALRFAVEIYRNDEPHWILSRFTNAQAVAMLMMPVGAVALWLTQRKQQSAPSPQ
jgi:phosphatidylglycerol:prolipoprotein diacylglycerol transferase